MSQYSWATCPETVHSHLNNLSAEFKRIVDENLIDIYLHGSLAMGCFNPARSDIDLLVVTQHGMPVETKRDIAQILLTYSLSPSPVEISFLVLSDIHPFQHPLPFDLHYSESWRGQYTQALADGTWRTWNDEKKRDHDLAAHITVTRARGICLYGKPILEVLPPVPPAFYTTSIVGDFNDALAERQLMPVYFTLNACRILAYLRDGYIYSKEEGGVWGLQTLPPELHGVVAQALEMYRGNMTDRFFDEAALTQFAQYMQRNIHS